MPCPVCDATLDAVTTLCPACGTDLGVFLAVQTFRQELQWAQAQATGMVTQLSRMQERLEQLHLLVQSSLPPHAAVSPGTTGVAPVPVESAALLPAAEAMEPLPEEVAPAPALTPLFPEGAELRFGQKWLLLVGVAMTVLGIGFFLKYAFDQDWVGPAGRIALGYLAAGAFLWGGDVLRRRLAAVFGLCLTGGGLATLYLVTFAAFQLYHLLGQPLAFSVLVLVTVVACLLALVYDTQWLAVLGLVGGFVTPVILSSGQAAQVTLMSYMVLLNGGILTLAAWKRWPLLNRLGFLCTWVLFSGWFVTSYTTAAFWRTLIFTQIFFLIYAWVPFLYYFVHTSKVPLSGLSLTGLNTVLAFGYTYLMIRDYTVLPLASVATLAYAGLFFGMATLLARRHPENVEPFVLLLAKGLLFLILTVPLLCSRHWITFFWGIQALVILWAGLRLNRHWLCYGALGLLLLATGKWLLYDYDVVFHLRPSGLYYGDGYTARLPERWMTTVLVLGALYGSAHLLRTATGVLGAVQTGLVALLYGVFGALLFLALTLEVNAWAYEYAPRARFAAISVLWTLCSIVVIALGFWQQQARLRLVALSLFGVTVLKVFLVDMANVSTPFRIVSFVVLGLMLIGASSLYYRYRSVFLPPPPPEEPS
ncbi:MAG: DUF2339 domain-containing protein [Candidatus Tectimicrobiota bacterium]